MLLVRLRLLRRRRRNDILGAKYSSTTDPSNR